MIKECNIVPLGEFGKNYMAYSGCYWCECADECREVYKGKGVNKMGMFNEIFCKCPQCGAQGYLQLPEFVLGFGGFDLENPETLLELSYEDLDALRAIIDKESFNCEKCENYFLYSPVRESKLEHIKKLFG